MNRVVALVVAIIFIALPLLPAPQVCCMRVAAAKMHPCCPATTSRAPIKAVRIRADVAPPPAAPALHPAAPAAEEQVVRVAVRGAFWQPLATIQLRI